LGVFAAANCLRAANVTIKTLAQGSENYSMNIGKIELLGPNAALDFVRDASGLMVTLPNRKQNDFAYALKITPEM
jgi:alpha-L-fucosidase